MKSTYFGRVNRAIDFIESNLDRNITLEELAEVANFPRFHFHRIFSAATGETLFQFIQRVRLERAASLLLQDTDRPITDIALDYGFSSSAVFARSFKNNFGMSASKWRDGGYIEFSKQRKMVSNNSETLRKYGEESPAFLVYLERTTSVLKWRIQSKGERPMESNVEVREINDIHVAYIRYVGPYAGDENLFEGLFERLIKWAAPRGLFTPPDTKILSIYHDDPKITDDEKLRTSVCVTVPENTIVDGEIGKTVVKGGKYAVGRFELNADQYGEAWGAMYQGWLPESGFQPDDEPPFELYLNNPKEHPEGKCIVEIWISVKPL